MAKRKRSVCFPWSERIGKVREKREFLENERVREREGERERERMCDKMREEPSVYSERGIFGTSSKIGIGLKQLIMLALFGYLRVYLA